MGDAVDLARSDETVAVVAGRVVGCGPIVVRPRLPDLSARPALKQGLAVAGGLLTFHYVALGWVWFALPSAGLSWQVFLKLLKKGFIPALVRQIQELLTLGFYLLLILLL